MKFKTFKTLFIFLILIFHSYSLYAFIIYRPANKDELNEIRCYLKILDQEGNDVTEKISASYAWIDQKEKLYSYEKKYYLMGGMAMHVGIPEGKFSFIFYTPVEKQSLYPGAKKLGNKVWESRPYTVDSANLPKVFFVSPLADENGFFKGEWLMDYRAPKFYKWTKQKIIFL